LSKKFFFNKDDLELPEKSEGTHISWLPGKNVTKETIKKK